jgi:hypothetical protein
MTAATSPNVGGKSCCKEEVLLLLVSALLPL